MLLRRKVPVEERRGDGGLSAISVNIILKVK